MVIIVLCFWLIDTCIIIYWLSLFKNLLDILWLLRENLRVGIPSWLYGAVLRLGLTIWVAFFCTHFYLDIMSFIWCVRIAQLVYWVSFRENCSVCSCRCIVSAEGGDEFRIPLCCHLTLDPHPIIFLEGLRDAFSGCLWIHNTTLHPLLCNNCALHTQHGALYS